MLQLIKDDETDERLILRAIIAVCQYTGPRGPELTDGLVQTIARLNMPIIGMQRGLQGVPGPNEQALRQAQDQQALMHKNAMQDAIRRGMANTLT